MTLKEISDLLYAYGHYKYVSGSYSHLSGEATAEYLNRASQVREELISAIIEFRLREDK